jgi:outer membrane protein assembly factor BamE (lipoprotein component of BamABCDE complex)
MKQNTIRSLAGVLSILLLCGGCGKSGPAPGFNQANYDRITVGMSKTDVEAILGQPKTTQQRQTLKFESGETRWDPEVLYHYEDGNKTATITIKEDKVSAKDPTIQGGP